MMTVMAAGQRWRRRSGFRDRWLAIAATAAEGGRGTGRFRDRGNGGSVRPRSRIGRSDLSPGTLLNRGLSLLIAAVYLGVEWRQRGFGRNVWQLGIALLWVLSLIWYGDVWGRMTGIGGSRGPAIDAETPGCLVTAGGWFFLVGMPIVIYGLVR